MIAQLWDLSFLVKLETVEAVLAGDGPLLGGCRCHSRVLGLNNDEMGDRIEDGYWWRDCRSTEW